MQLSNLPPAYLPLGRPHSCPRLDLLCQLHWVQVQLQTPLVLPPKSKLGASILQARKRWKLVKESENCEHVVCEYIVTKKKKGMLQSQSSFVPVGRIHWWLRRRRRSTRSWSRNRLAYCATESSRYSTFATFFRPLWWAFWGRFCSGLCFGFWGFGHRFGHRSSFGLHSFKLRSCGFGLRNSFGLSSFWLRRFRRFGSCWSFGPLGFGHWSRLCTCWLLSRPCLAWQRARRSRSSHPFPFAVPFPFSGNRS